MDKVQRRLKVLQFFYDRAEGSRFHKPFSDEFSTNENSEIETACYHLRDLGYLEWYGPIGSRFEGGGRITGRGASYLEEMEKPAMSAVSYNIGTAQNIQIGNGNTMNVGDVSHRVVDAIDRSGATPAAKAEAKSLWAKLTNNQSFAAIVGAIGGAAASTLKIG